MALSQWKEAILEGIFMEIEEGVVMEKNLERLENLVEILHKEGSKVPKSVKEAYCQVAVECTAKCLAYEENAKEAYTEAIRSIWVRRIMPLCDKVSCLVTSDLLNSCRRLWSAHNDEKACESLVDDNTREKALVSLRKVVTELHPNFDSAYEDRNDESMDDESEEMESSEESGDTEPMVEEKEIEVNTEAIDLDEEVNTEAVGLDEEVNTEAVDLDQEAELERPNSKEAEAESPPRQIKTISTAIFNRALADLRVSKIELVNALKEGGGPSSLNNEAIIEQDNDGSSPFATNTRPKASFMERRSTAHTFEWEDSSDESDKEMGDDGEKKNKSSRIKIVVSPLKKKSEGSRRTYVPWSTAETLAVLKGYEKYGANWKRIKDECPILERRTNGDIKDKFRVEMKRQERHP